MINTLLGLTLFNPIVFVGIFIIAYTFFSVDLASFSSKNIKNYINL